MPFVILTDDNIEDVSIRTERTVEELKEFLEFYKERGVYPVKVPVPIDSPFSRY